jgi:protein-disulfide isomerase
MTKEVKLVIGIAAVVLAVGIGLFVLAPKPVEVSKPVDGKSLVRENSHMTGSVGAKVTVVEFADFQCPACGSAHPIMKKVQDAYKDNTNVNFVYRNFPLDSIHPNARIGAEAAEAAGKQGKFWQMHDLLFERQSDWSELSDPTDKLVSYASELGLDTAAFKTSLQQRLFNDVISADVKDGEALDVNSTPTFFINGQIYRKILSFDDFKKYIDAELAK